MDKEQRLPSVPKNCEQEEAIAETASKLADKTRESLNAWHTDGRDECALNALRARGPVGA